MPWREWGTEDMPLRASWLPGLARCPSFIMLRDARMLDYEDRVGKAATTGTAVGRVIELWHRGHEFREAMRTVEEEDAAGAWRPAADLRAVERWAYHYCEDPRNPWPIVPEESLEVRVRLELDPHPSDPTREPIVIIGHTDQVRRDPMTGVLSLWDVKSGRTEGRHIVNHYAWQLAAYTLGVADAMQATVLPGGIIRLRDYDDGGPVFWPAPWTIEACHEMMRGVAYIVAQIRRGEFLAMPGDHCAWCPAAGPHACGDLLEDALKCGI